MRSPLTELNPPGGDERTKKQGVVGDVTEAGGLQQGHKEGFPKEGTAELGHGQDEDAQPLGT